MAAAIASRAAFFWAVPARANAREALRACSPSVRM
jgi:hypothetical protein